MSRIVGPSDPLYEELLSFSGGAVIFTKDGSVWRFYGDRFIEVEREVDRLSFPPHNKAEGWLKWYGPVIKGGKR